jgi:hypothetical protein
MSVIGSTKKSRKDEIKPTRGAAKTPSRTSSMKGWLEMMPTATS